VARSSPTREAIMQAFYSLITSRLAGTNYPYMSVSRRLCLATEVPELSQPAMFIREFDEVATQKQRGTPGSIAFKIFIIVYAKNDDPSVPGATIVNPIVDLIEDLLEPDNRNVDTVTLPVNGQALAYSCEINGTIVKENGDTDPNGQCLVIVPIKLISA
jgi:hypothetical protein